MIITKSSLAITIPINTPTKLSSTAVKIIIGVEKELNWVTIINKIKNINNNHQRYQTISNNHQRSQSYKMILKIHLESPRLQQLGTWYT